MTEGKKVTITTLMDIYCDGLQTAIKQALSRDGTVDGWYEHYLEEDNKNTKAVNEEIAKKNKAKNSDGSKQLSEITNITEKIGSIEEFDFQAYNKTFVYLKNIRNEIFEYYGLKASSYTEYSKAFSELLDFRNRFYGHNNNAIAEGEREKADIHAADNMKRILKEVFGRVKDANGILIYDKFMDKYIEFNRQKMLKKYYISDFLDLKEYNISIFLETCARLGIDDCGIDNGRYYLYSYNIENDIERLKNFMIIDGEGYGNSLRDRGLDPLRKEDLKTVKTESNKNTYKVIIALAVLVAVTIVIVAITSLIGKISDNVDLGEAYKGDIGVSSLLNSTTPSSNDKPSSDDKNGSGTSEESGQAPQNTSGENQIPKEYEQQVIILKNSNPQRLRLMTLNCKIGEYATPYESGTWGSGTIYSQDTSIAVAEGLLIKGVSKGETYCIYEHNGLTVAYRIIVE